MTKDEIMLLDLDGIEKRKAELNIIIDEAESMDALEPVQEELIALEERKSVIAAEIEKRKADMKTVADGAGKPIEVRKDNEVMSNIEVRNTPEYINAFAEYIKTGKDMECRALLTENVSGSVPVPEFVYDIVKTAWDREEVMSLVNKTNFRGNLKVGFEISGDDAIVHTEGAGAIDPENLVLGIVELVPTSIKKVLPISDEVYDLRGESFLRYVYEELTHRIAKKCADIMIAKIIACPTASTTTCPAVPVSTITAPGLGDVATAMGYLSDEAANPVIIMHRQTEAAYKALRVDGNFAYDPFEGLRVVHNNTMKTAAAASTGDTIAIVGDLGHGAIANFPNGEDIDFKFDDMTRKKEDIIEVLGRRYVGMGVVAPDAFVKITKA